MTSGGGGWGYLYFYMVCVEESVRYGNEIVYGQFIILDNFLAFTSYTD